MTTATTTKPIKLTKGAFHIVGEVKTFGEGVEETTHTAGDIEHTAGYDLTDEMIEEALAAFGFVDIDRGPGAYYQKVRSYKKSARTLHVSVWEGNAI